MTPNELLSFQNALALAGGALIGLAGSLLWLLLGRPPGISGIAAGLLQPVRQDVSWRLAFLGGMAAAGVVAARLAPAALAVTTGRPLVLFAVGGLAIGYGARLGNGCTSGHGICGVSRFSPRSLVATTVFVAVGMVTSTLADVALGGAR